MTEAGSPGPAVVVDHVSVRYRVPRERIPSLKEYAIRRLTRAVGHHELLALHDVDLTVQPGEVLGIVGPNGAGKSTLLKVVARVLRPTVGRVQSQGRVTPLLELGAGFDYELTGRENILLNGAMLGYSLRDMTARLDRIVEFAGLLDFIDAPLRTYSTGMVARLGFAVATDVAPEILLVDEVLAVGDAEFQQKSAERLRHFRQTGATVLLVSHSLPLIQTMCTRAIWLDQGRIRHAGSAESVVRQYLEDLTAAEVARMAFEAGPAPERRVAERRIEIVGVRLAGESGSEQTSFETGRPWVLWVDYYAHSPVPRPVFGIAIHRQDGLFLTGPNTSQAGLALPALAGRGTVMFSVPYLSLLDGLYQVSVSVLDHDTATIYDHHDRAYPFRVLNRNGQIQESYGLLTLRGEWRHHSAQEA